MTASEILELFLATVWANPGYSIHDESFAPCMFIAEEIQRDPAVLDRLEAFLKAYRSAEDTEDDEEARVESDTTAEETTP
jgi:hypothetical protein